MNWRRTAATAVLAAVVLLCMTGCPAKPPKSPQTAVSVRADGIKVVSGEHIDLQVVASDACGNASSACLVDVDTLCLDRPKPLACPDVGGR